jgi:hypothetical protein
MHMKGQRSDAHPRNPDVVRSSTAVVRLSDDRDKFFRIAKTERGDVLLELPGAHSPWHGNCAFAVVVFLTWGVRTAKESGWPVKSGELC